MLLDWSIMLIKARSTAANDFIEKIIKAGTNDKQLTSYKTALESKRLINNLTLEDELILYKNQIYIPDCNELKLTVIRQANDAKEEGHFGWDKRLELLTRNYYWPNLEEWVKTYVQTCNTCQRKKTARYRKHGCSQPLDVPYRAWQHIFMDFITDLPKVNGYDQIWVIVDRFSKIAHFIPLKNRLAHNLTIAFIWEV